MLDKITARQLIKPHMVIECSPDGELGTVDHISSSGSIVLAPEDGEAHQIPLDWVTSVDQVVHIEYALEDARRDWTTAPSPSKW